MKMNDNLYRIFLAEEENDARILAAQEREAEEARIMEELEAIYDGLFAAMLDAEHAQDWETYWNLRKELRNFW